MLGGERLHDEDQNPTMAMIASIQISRESNQSWLGPAVDHQLEGADEGHQRAEAQEVERSLLARRGRASMKS